MEIDKFIESLAGLDLDEKKIRAKGYLDDKKEELAQQYANSNMSDKEMKAKIRTEIRAMSKQIKESFDAVQTLRATTLKPFFSMNITYKGVLQNENNFNNVEMKMKNQIKIANPNEAFTAPGISDKMSAFLSKVGMKNFQAVVDKIKDLTGKEETAEVVRRKSSALEILGAVDVSKKSTREEVYAYFEELKDKKFPEFTKDATAFFDALAKMNPPQEDSENLFSETIEKAGQIKKKYLDNFDKLDYIGIFEHVEKDVIPENLRFYSYVAQLIASQRLFTLGSQERSQLEEDESDNPNWMADALTEAMEQFSEAESEWDRGTTVDLEIRAEDFDDIETDIEEDLQNLDPLLAWEYSRGTKLLSITERGEQNLIELLTNAREEIESDEIQLSIDFDTDIENWLDELSDTTIIEDRQEFYLPISVIEDNDMSELYDPSDVEDSSLENLQFIEDFFEELGDLIMNDVVRLANFYQKTGPLGAGTDMKPTFRGDSSRAGRARESEYYTQYGRDADVNEALTFDEGVKTAFMQMIESASAYYFRPAFSGLMTINVPKFVSSIGGRIIEMAGAKLGLETAMGPAYSKLANASVGTIKPETLDAISDFLEAAFTQSISIDTSLIDKGLKAAEALTEIFGREESNYDYVGGVLAHLMELTENVDRLNTDFKGQSIIDRASDYLESIKSRDAIPIFAMPYWLNANRGLIKEENPEQYERLVNIFQEVQADLPVLLRKMLNAHDVIREQLGKPVVHGILPLNEYGYDVIVKKMQTEENLDLSNYEVDRIIKEMDSHENISKEFGVTTEQVYLIKAHFR